jgi:hypothetical protein
LHLDRSYDSNLTTEARCHGLGLTDIVWAKKKPSAKKKLKDEAKGKSHSLCDGPLNAPTPGSRTSASSAAAPTGSAGNDSDRSPSPSPSS